MRLGFVLVFLVLAAVFAFAELPPQPPAGNEEIAISFYSLSGETVESLAGLPLSITFNSSSDSFFDVHAIPPSQEMVFYLGEGSWTATAEIDDPATSAKDYFAKSTFEVKNGSSYSLFFERVGSVNLRVYHSNASVSGVEITGSCVSEHYSFEEMNGRVVTDSSGSVLIKFLPAGDCVLSANSPDYSGSEKISVKKGALLDSTLVLEKKANGYSWVWTALWGLGAIVLLAFAAYLFWRKREETGVKSAKIFSKEAAAVRKPVGKTVDRSFMRALDANERKIVEALLENKRLKQSVLFKKLLIPKTTLIRTIQKLERKKIVKTTPVGKTRWVELEKWLGKGA